MASQWGFVGANAKGWYGSGIRTTLSRQTVLAPGPEPIIFKPTDLSFCSIWYDANNLASITTLEDSTVLNWDNLGTIGGFLQPSSGSGQSGVSLLNGLNVVSFGDSATMVMSNVSITDQPRTFFIVSQSRTDITNPPAGISYFYGLQQQDGQFSSYYSGGVFTYIICANGVYCPIIASGPDPFNNAYSICFRNSATDLSENLVSINGVAQTLTNSELAGSFSDVATDYYVNSTSGSSQYIGEIIWYARALSDAEVLQVTTYLVNKWGLVAPPAPAPKPPSLNTSIIYGAYIEGEYPNFYWCDDFGNVEIPYVLAAGYDGTTAYRDGTPVTVTNVFYS